MLAHASHHVPRSLVTISNGSLQSCDSGVQRSVEVVLMQPTLDREGWRKQVARAGSSHPLQWVATNSDAVHSRLGWGEVHVHLSCSQQPTGTWETLLAEESDGETWETLLCSSSASAAV